jgi:hypothetical protein
MVSTNRNILILFSTRIIRLFCYGFLSVVLALYLAQIGLPEQQIGLLFTLTLVGDAGISLWLTTSADRIGRKRMQSAIRARFLVFQVPTQDNEGVRRRREARPGKVPCPVAFSSSTTTPPAGRLRCSTSGRPGMK